MSRVQCNERFPVDTAIITTITIIAYLVITTGYFRLLSTRDRRVKSVLNTLTILPLALHGYELHHLIDTGSGQNLAYFNLLSMTLWLIAIIVLGFNFKKQLSRLMLLVLPLCALSLLLIHFVPGEYVVDASSPGFLIHTLISLATLSILGVASAQALFVSRLDKQLKSNSAPGENVPALQDMESFLYGLIYASFAFLTLTIASALIFLTGGTGSVSLHKPVLSVIAWLVLGYFIYGRIRFGWRAMTAVRFTLSGFILLFLAYFGTRTVLEFILG